MNIESRKIRKILSILLQIGLIVILFVFLFLPLITLLFNATSNEFNAVFSNENFYKSILNSLIYTFTSSIITVILATLCAYMMSRIKIKGKNWLILFLIFPMLIPTISIGLGIRGLFGNSGFMKLLFGVVIDADGFLGLILGSVVYTFPVAFLLIYDALLYEDRSVYDAANTLGVKRFRTFFGITIPYLKTTLISAFFACFTLIFTDYGLPMEVRGNVKTLSFFLYEEVMSTQNYIRGAVISIVLIMPAIVAFIFDVLNKDSSSGVARKENITPSKTFNYVGLGILIFVGLVIALPIVSFVVISFVKDFPNNMSLTFDNYKYVFDPFGSANVPKLLGNSLIISLLTAAIGTVFAYLNGYCTSRSSGKLKGALHLGSIATIAIPGMLLGIGYAFFFQNTKGWFANTLLILVVVNIIHYFSSPYLMARNAFEKIDKNYETVAETLGISRTSVFFKVMIPNTIGTILQMFSYLFINSMITISAVSFLASTDAIKPLAVAITTWEEKREYANESVVSTIILLINLLVKIGFDLSSKYISNLGKRKAEEGMVLNRFQFTLLTFIDDHKGEPLTQRKVADGVTLSLGTTNKILNQFVSDDLIIMHSDKTIEITEKGYKALEPYKVRKAIIIAAGFGSRMAPVTLDTPKPLVKVNGVRIIDTMIDALLAKDITNITIVVGYKKEQFNQLLEKYPMLKFIENPIYNESNNISSMYAAVDIIDRCYICEADLIVSDPSVITKYQYCSNYLGAYVSETDDWCFFKKGNYINKVSIGGENCWHMIGISYWDEKDSLKLREDIVKTFKSRGGKEKYWDDVPLTNHKYDFHIEVRECKKSCVTEIDNFSELVLIDPSYIGYEQKNK